VIRINTNELNIQQTLELIDEKLEEVLPKSLPPAGQQLLEKYLTLNCKKVNNENKNSGYNSS
ncbi:MAG: hypothetical protein ACTSWY_01045, partial [Promethearchaeota archaeon]